MNVFGATPKYQGVSLDPIDNTPLSWRAHPDGLPVREGDAPGVVGPAQAAAARTTFFARSAVFEIPKDIDKYNAMVDWVVNTTGGLPDEKTQELPDGRWIVWARWVDVRGFIPQNPPFPGLAGRQ